MIRVASTRRRVSALLYARVILEVFIVFFRIRDDTEEIANSKR